MKHGFIGATLFFLISATHAQTVIPPMPGKSTNIRPVGGGTSGGVAIIPKESPKVRYTTHIVLSVSRLWTSTEGKLLEGKLIAFEDLVAEAPKGTETPPAPSPPEHPTVVRGDKIRLLIDKKTVELPINRLSEGDREFIGQVRKAYGAKTPPTP